MAVPVPPPDAYRAKVGVARVQRLAEDAGAAGALSTNQILELVRAQGTTIPLEQWVICDASRPDSTAQWRSIHPLPSTLAYLQYTSGSTSAPKGVMVSHGNMTAQSRCITEAGRYDADSVTLSWMPHFHDYGLVKGIVQPAWIGRPAYLMSPLTFLKRPLRWLEAIQRYHVTHSGAPNFAYRRCVETIAAEDRARLDLSGWQVASCGAEPIAHDTIDRFAEAFAPAGFRREAFFPAYGMAEYTLLISLKRESVAPTVLSLDPATLERGWCRKPRPVSLPSGRSLDAVLRWVIPGWSSPIRKPCPAVPCNRSVKSGWPEPAPPRDIGTIRRKLRARLARHFAIREKGRSCGPVTSGSSETVKSLSPGV